MTEQQAIEALHALPRLPRSGASLERMQALLDHLGNPEKHLSCCKSAVSGTTSEVCALAAAVSSGPMASSGCSG